MTQNFSTPFFQDRRRRFPLDRFCYCGSIAGSLGLSKKVYATFVELLKSLIGKKVTVYSLQGGGQERQDVGVLEASEGLLLQIRKGENEVLIFTLPNVRLIKPFEAL